MKLSADVVIVGGGIVGATTAALMARSGSTVVLLERSTPRFENMEGPHARVSAIAPKAEEVFRDLQVWDAILPYHRTPYEQMVVWDATKGSEGKITFDAATLGEPCLGTIVDNRALLKVLWDHMGALGQVSLLTDEVCLSMARQENTTAITTKKGHTITGKLVVGADGAQSWVREAGGFSLKKTAYGHHAIVAVVETEQPHQHTAWQRFLPEGPLAFLPLSAPPGAAPASHYSAIVWSTDPKEAETLMALDEKEFCEACGKAFNFTLGKISHCAERFVFPLNRQHATRYVKAGIALVGDAAHTLHPLAGQGMNLGIYDAVALADVVKKAREQKRDFASYHTLRAYERQRKIHNTVMLASMDGFNGLFGNHRLWVGALRRWGLRGLDQWPCIKEQIMRYALG